MHARNIVFLFLRSCRCSIMLATFPYREFLRAPTITSNVQPTMLHSEQPSKRYKRPSALLSTQGERRAEQQAYHQSVKLSYAYHT